MKVCTARLSSYEAGSRLRAEALPVLRLRIRPATGPGFGQCQQLPPGSAAVGTEENAPRQTREAGGKNHKSRQSPTSGADRGLSRRCQQPHRHRARNVIPFLCTPPRELPCEMHIHQTATTSVLLLFIFLNIFEKI